MTDRQRVDPDWGMVHQRRIAELEAEVERLRELLGKARGVVGVCHIMEEGPNAGWRDATEYDLGWYDDDLVCRADCPVCAVDREISAALDDTQAGGTDGR